jgi:hypothetical protein
MEVSKQGREELVKKEEERESKSYRTI